LSLEASLSKKQISISINKTSMVVYVYLSYSGGTGRRIKVRSWPQTKTQDPLQK
jgi:hypothetical protein